MSNSVIWNNYKLAVESWIKFPVMVAIFHDLPGPIPRRLSVESLGIVAVISSEILGTFLEKSRKGESPSR